MMNRKLPPAIVLALSVLFAFTACKTGDLAESVDRVPASEKVYPWSYDAGPDLSTGMGRALVQLNSAIPNFPALSDGIYGTKRIKHWDGNKTDSLQKFRPAFGPMPWRMMQKPNSVKILFIGQDGTHIAEAAGRPATAGFGGRAMDLAKYFGVSSGAAFINTYAFTIQGQYGAYGTPVVNVDANGKPVPTTKWDSKLKKNVPVVFDLNKGLTDNATWMLSQDPRSPIVQWRNSLIDWIIANNRESLRMIVVFGGAARDAAATYINSRGGEVGTFHDEQTMRSLRVAETELVAAGGNNEFPVPFTAQHKDVYSTYLKKKLNYNKPMEGGDAPGVIEVEAALRKPELNMKIVGGMVFSQGGLSGSGVLHPAQLGGYDLDDKTKINGEYTISLRGLEVPEIKADGQVVSPKFKISNDILVAQLPHPTALSMMKSADAAKAVAAGLTRFQKYVDRGWAIQPDPGLTNSFAAKKPYKYARADMGPETYDFGAPALRMVNKSDAVRVGANVIVIGSREKAAFGTAALKAKLDEMANAKPAEYPDKNEMWTTRPRGAKSQYVFDPGPGEKYARLMKENLPKEFQGEWSASTEKKFPGQVPNRDYAHYRGTFKNPEVLVLADPHGYDDIITARALTGTRGQYLQGLMEDIRVNDQYLVIKTAPYAHEPASEWTQIVEMTKVYRERLIRQILTDSKPKVIIADGPVAQAEIQRILPNSQIPVVRMDRTEKHSTDMQNAGDAIRALGGKFASVDAKGKMRNIPRTHLSYYARLWEGTSGDRVIVSNVSNYTNYEGKKFNFAPGGKDLAYAEVAPYWATSQKAPVSFSDRRAIELFNEEYKKQGLRKPDTSIGDFAKKLNSPTLMTGSN